MPAAIIPSDLQSTIVVIDQFLETPFDLDGKKPSQLFSKKRRRRRRRSPSPSSDDDVVFPDDEPKKKKRKEKKKKEKEQYKSAQFIEDSDEEYGDIEAFLEKEKEMRERASKAAAAAGEGRIGTMKPTGTKKRRRKAGGDSTKNKKRKNSRPVSPVVHPDQSNDSDAESVGLPTKTVEEPTVVPRPRPKPIFRRAASARASSPSVSEQTGGDGPHISRPSTPAGSASTRRTTNRLVISDEDSDS